MNPDEKKPADLNEYSNVRIDEFQLGVWRFKIATETGFNPQKYWEDVKVSLPLFFRLAVDVFTISPRLFTIYIVCQIWQGIEDTILLQLSNNLLKTVEAGLVAGKPDSRAIASAMLTRVLCTVFVSYIQWYGAKTLEILENQVTRHYELILMQSNLRLDLPTSQAPGNKQEATASQAWDCLQNIINFATMMLKSFSQLLLIFHISRSNGGPFFAILCASEPISSVLFSRSAWNQVCFGFINNTYYQRMISLKKMVNDKYRQDIISGGLGQWISKEFKLAHTQVGNLSETHPFIQFSRVTTTPFNSLWHRFLGDLPMLYCASEVMLRPTRLSLSSIAILQQSSSTVRNSISFALHSGSRFQKNLTLIKTIYNATIVKNTMKVGSVSYPHIPENPIANVNPSKGMSFQLKNVTFSYSGAQKETPALKDINLTIKPGSLVVIVGANGSGKSTLIRILSRLYDPSSGEVLIDGLPSSDYKIDDLHQATALLSQDSTLYPLSLAENIGLGCEEYVHDMDMITEAAKQGGALQFTEKFKEGMQTMLDPCIQSVQRGLYGNHNHPLYKEMQTMKKQIDISGGEKQRVVASRSFMRFKSGKVSFVAVDEPSSALDAEGELDLFKNLLAVRDGKTMVFVTHRFGHLTKHANLILCMKDGSVVESGTHEDLMKLDGEYAKLYNIQANAFSDKWEI
ncbi:ATP-dependent lipid A-core flippase [Psilocybe cubensis]|uniref:ATP-dependent lipid A-core flippase n=2 Tax=Psilocybe cubensis TaxID=181762 RepID=A0ACB8HBR3_PSICU|nr:ATP-dependent lipid A-core flippase [Psilocybe cubensis]KAH9484595.1 ATP-dependent lipid A-core flippase [Psilocybe cubensis]